MPTQEEQLPRRKLRVVSLEKLGKTKKGGWIYKVNAVDEEGSPVEEELRIFQEVPTGELIEFAVKRYDHEKYGLTWTLFPPKETKEQKKALAERVDDLERRVAALEQKGQRPSGITPSVQPSGDGSRFGEEPPF